MGKKRQCPSDLINCDKRFFIPHSMVYLPIKFKVMSSEFRVRKLKATTSNYELTTPNFFFQDILYHQIPNTRGAISHLASIEALHILPHYLHDACFNFLSSF